MYIILPNHGFTAKNIYNSSVVRQADHYSCHTDALVILRNALLSLRYHRFTNGFKEALQDAQLKENEIISLPDEWDYTSQIKTVVTTKQKAIRSFFSKKQEKAQTVTDHREKHTKPHTFKCTIYSFNCGTPITAPHT